MTKNQYLCIGVILLLSLGVAFVISDSIGTLMGPDHRHALLAPEQPAPQLRVYNDWDNGTLSTISPGDIVAIRLPENPTTGYQWDISGTSGIRIVEDSYIYPDPSSKMTGQGGWRHITVTPDSTSGKGSFAAVCKRWWEPETGAEKHYTLDFEIR
jgi:inhibitor of cysteine peptidase